jgi:4-amino-4-deoxy-L-arabinose transferase-like glycosyltransferase
MITKPKTFFSKHWLLISLFLLSILTLLPVSPIIQHTPPRDSGIFLYVGSRLLKGDVLYRDVWDHKPPVVFLINAAGLLVSGGSIWGVWILEVIAVLASVWMAYFVLRNSFGNTAAALGIVSGLTILFLTLHGGNYVEEYAIPFQFASFFFLYQAEQKERVWPALACGIAIGILFFLRQTLIGVGIAIALYLVMRAVLGRSWLPFRQLGFIMLGALSVSVVILIYLAIQGILPEFWDAAFIYNAIYSNLGLIEQLKALGDSLRFFSRIPLLLLSLAAWLLALFLLLRHGSGRIVWILKNRRTGWLLLMSGILLIAFATGVGLLPGSRNGFGLAQQAVVILGIILTILALLQLFDILPRLALPGLEKITYHLSPATVTIISVAVIWYPIEFVMINLSGRSYLHYYMTVCAVCTVLFTFLAGQFQKAFGLSKAKGLNIILVLAWSIGIAGTLAYNPVNPIKGAYIPEGDSPILETVRYIDANTRPDDKVLVWGAEPLVYFFSQRSAPIRYTHLYPFYTENYGGEALSAELLASIQIKKPLLIIDTLNADLPFAKITPDHKCELPVQPLLAGMDQVMKAICADYYYVGEVDSTGWKIYRLNK